jgi:UDP-N-acetylglucosamine--N-acetylmuramyl-(pentapeptide) pyrophosphoryl-undecaprenol N-acetylglucosamine transferase
MTVVIAGGGTGGHLFPGIALADALARRGVGIVFVGTAGGIEARVVPTTPYPLRLLPGRQLRGGGPGGALLGLVTAGGAALRAVTLLGAVGPALVVGVGGYASVAVVVAAALRRVPSVLLEQNVVPGAANRLLARLAAAVCVGFAESGAFFPAGRTIHTGNPVRDGVVRPRKPHADPTVLVFGGSAGAHRLNVAVLEAFTRLGRTRRMRVVHQTGLADVETVRTGYARLGIDADVVPFIADMGAAYATADVVVARAGAMTCAEVTAVGLPAILVPYPHAADDHQRRNAEVLVAAGAAEMILDRDLTGEHLGARLVALLDAPDRRAELAARARALGRPDAAERVADACLRLAAPDPARKKMRAAAAAP